MPSVFIVCLCVNFVCSIHWQRRVCQCMLARELNWVWHKGCQTQFSSWATFSPLPKKNNSIWFFSPLSSVVQGVFLNLKLVTINPCELCLQNVQNKVFLLNTIYLRMTYLQGGWTSWNIVRKISAFLTLSHSLFFLIHWVYCHMNNWEISGKAQNLE